MAQTGGGARAVKSEAEAVEAVEGRGIPHDLAVRWVATGLVDADGERVCPTPVKYDHWIQMKHTLNGLFRYQRDNPRLTLDEVQSWHETGWDPERVVPEFQDNGYRRPWESLFDPASDGTGQHLRKRLTP